MKDADRDLVASHREALSTATARVWVRAVVWGVASVAAGAVLLRAVNVAYSFVRPTSDAKLWIPDFVIGTETVDRLIWLSALAATAILFVLVRVGPTARWIASPLKSLSLAFIGLVGLVLGVAWIEPLADPTDYWFGFGTNVLLAALVLVPVIYVIMNRPDPRVMRFLAVSSASLGVVVYLPSVLHPIWGVINDYHSGFIFNEVLAPTQGHFLLGDQIPQYTTMFGLPLAPLWLAFPSLNQTPAVGIIVSSYLTLLALATLAGLVAVAYRVLPLRARALAFLITVPLVLVKTQPADVLLGSIATLLSALPIRTFPVILIGLLLTLYADRNSLRWAGLVGIVAGLAALNNFEFGVPCAIAAGIVVVLGQYGLRTRAVSCIIFLVTALVPLALYAALLAAVGQPVNLGYLVAFALSFGSGFASVPMPIVGLHLFVLAILIAGVASGAYFLRASNDACLGTKPRPAAWTRQRRAAMTALFFGLAGLGSFGYYVGRSIVSGQLQIFLFFIAPIIAANFALLSVPKLDRRASWLTITSTILLLFPPALAIASVLQAPDARQEWRRVAITTKPSAAQDEASAKQAAIAAQASDSLGGIPLVTAVANGNYLEAYSSLPNYSAVDDPADLWMLGQGLRDAFCQRLATAPAPILAENFYDDSGSGLCSGFTELLRISDIYSVVEPATRVTSGG